MPVEHLVMAVEAAADGLWKQQKLIPAKNFLRVVQLGGELLADATRRDFNDKGTPVPKTEAFPPQVLQAIRTARAAGRIRAFDQVTADAQAELAQAFESQPFQTLSSAAAGVEQTPTDVLPCGLPDTSSAVPEAHAEQPEAGQEPAPGTWAELLETVGQSIDRWNAKEQLSEDDLRFVDELPDLQEGHRPTDAAAGSPTLD